MMVTAAELLEQLGKPGSAWRNPTVATVLHETGFAETKGSGIRVMRRQMDRAGLTPPVFESVRHEDRFMAMLLFVHFLDAEAVEWLKHFRHWALSEEECRALLFVRETGRITNADYRDQNRVDTLTASQQLTRLRDLHILQQVPRGSATFYVPGEHFPHPALAVSPLTDGQAGLPLDGETLPDNLEGLPDNLEDLPDNLELLPSESGELPDNLERLSDSEESAYSTLLSELPPELKAQVAALGQRARRPHGLDELIVALCRHRPYRPQELACLLKRNQRYLQTQYLTPLKRRDRLEYRYPDEPHHPHQAYLAVSDNRERE